MRRIVCSAIRNHKGQVILGVRHFDKFMRDQMGLDQKNNWKFAEQGFVDNNYEFLSREEAYNVALEADQIVKRVGGDEGCLYSENLY